MAPTTTEKKMEVSSGNYVSDDIAFCILSKLPVKSIKRFSSVRKSWSLLLENPNFFKMFRDNLVSKSHPLYDDACIILNRRLPSHGSILSFLSGDMFQNRVKLNLPHPFCTHPLRFIPIILGSAVNGTICIYYMSTMDAILWNPSVDQVKVIPPRLFEHPRPRPRPPKAVSVIRMVIGIQYHGFGYDHVRNDYKVIRHMEISSNNKKECFWEIYSLQSDSWKKKDFDMPQRRHSTDTDVYLNGVCHWCAQIGKNVELVSFELSNEVYFITPLPLESMSDGFHVYLQVLNGSVAVIVNHVKTLSFHISILGELGVKESWVRLFNIGPLSCIQRPVGAWKKGNIFFKTTNGELSCLDLTTGVIEEIGVKIEDRICQMVVYKKNLLPFGVTDN